MYFITLRCYIYPSCHGSQKLNTRRVMIWTERVFRGRRYPRLVQSVSATYKPDFRLIPKDEEAEWYKRLAECKPNERIYDRYVPLPPLLNVSLQFIFPRLYRR